jgi:hypothetical protein
MSRPAGEHQVYYVCQEDPEHRDFWQFKVGESGSGRYPFSIRMWEHFKERTNKDRMRNEVVHDGKKCEMIFIAYLVSAGYHIVPGTHETFYVHKEDDIHFMKIYDNGVQAYREQDYAAYYAQRRDLDAFIGGAPHVTVPRRAPPGIGAAPKLTPEKPVKKPIATPKPAPPAAPKPTPAKKPITTPAPVKRVVIDLTNDTFILKSAQKNIVLRYGAESHVYTPQTAGFLRTLLDLGILKLDTPHEFSEALFDAIRAAKPHVTWDYIDDIIKRHKFVAELDPYARLRNLLNSHNIRIRADIDLYMRKTRGWKDNYRELHCTVTTNTLRKEYAHKFTCVRVEGVFYEQRYLRYFAQYIDYFATELAFVPAMPAHNACVQLYNEFPPWISEGAFNAYVNAVLTTYHREVVVYQKTPLNNDKLPKVIMRRIMEKIS